MAALETKTVKLEQLTLDPNNVRTHDEKNLQAIARSLDTFGQRKPVVVARDADGGLVVVAGNGTVTAARALGWAEVVVTELPGDWDADKAKAFAIADNRTAELAHWDSEALLQSLTSLDDMLISASGFDEVDLKSLESLWGASPDLDDLLDEVGHPTEEDGMVRVSFLVPVEVAARWEMAVKSAGSGSELENTCTAVQAAFDAIVVDQ